LEGRFRIAGENATFVLMCPNYATIKKKRGGVCGIHHQKYVNKEI